MPKRFVCPMLAALVAAVFIAATACAPRPPVPVAQAAAITPAPSSTALPAGPTAASSDKSVANDIPTSTPVPTDTRTATVTATETDALANTPSPGPTNTIKPTATRSATATPRPITVAPTATRPPTSTPAPAYGMDAAAQQVFNLTNAERAKAGLAPLRLNATLISSAGWFAQDMLDNHVQNLSHTDSQGRDAPARIEAFGYRWLYYAENIAVGYPSPDAVVAGWMASPGHRENILNPMLTEIGIGHAPNGGWDYWVEDFGTR